MVNGIESNRMEERRKYKRFPTQLKALYLDEKTEEWKDCSVTNISREGMGICVYAQEIINVDSILQLKIIAPLKKEPIDVTGTLMWIRELKENPRFNFVGGAMIIAIDPEDKWALLDYVYEDWCRRE